jgi:hypothetical protein
MSLQLAAVSRCRFVGSLKTESGFTARTIVAIVVASAMSSRGLGLCACASDSVQGNHFFPGIPFAEVSAYEPDHT